MQLPVVDARAHAAPPRDPALSDGPRANLGDAERRIVAALAEAAIPAGRHVPAGGALSADRLAAFLGGWPSNMVKGIRGLLWSLELATVPTHGRRFSSLSKEARARFVEGAISGRGGLRREWMRALLSPLKGAHFDDPALFAAVGAPYRGAPVEKDEQPRWLERVTHGADVTADMSIECEVVVIGTGAGGAAAAYELASRGRAVVLLEEGRLHRRKDLTGRASHAFKHLYRDNGVTMALGNAPMPVLAGRAVGGSTIVNSGTCYRAPERTFRYWRERHGMPAEFSSEGMAPYYARVEQMLGVAKADRRYTGGVGEVIARGAEALGYTHGPLTRNAPDCDGQGMCCYGCPTGAKRSTDVSYVPAALMKGAELWTGAKARHVDVVAGRARGVTVDLSSGAVLKVKADAVIVAGGALMTPLLLRDSGACTTSGWLGRNLSIHPAGGALAVFDERIDMGSAIPQGYAIETFAEEGLMFEGGSLPPDVLALNLPWVGPRLTEIIDDYAHVASFGLMVQDHSRGTVRRGPGGSPLIRYDLSRRDFELMHRGLGVLAEVYLRAGARRVILSARGFEEVRTMREVEAFRQAPLRPGDVDGAAFHPLGTARAGADPRRSCVNPEQEAHDTERLYVCDGSAIPSSLGVNPQLTIMAMSLRAAEAIDARLG